ncbi:SnoaL-like domain protein [Sporomusa ovata DSM 2662]|uniref:Ketosteroid isomerase-like protein n=1 Tax=Sporomusa ovata TaxID=2378 RepID=A0A0U1KXJ0_9FIRM|nr:SgcJ/EcaC family oxidoreductase [Sporomusa ovata]EQB28633.1 hypothetical protein SOV_1c03220 [Sporomusa ovata DSM 2662]CQR72141.1 Ketosteroid isomerase-like protein [Sporomusa ovata]
MQNQEIKQLIEAADDAINREDFEALMEFYSDDAVLVVKPGLLVRGKEQIRKAFEAIAEYFNHSLAVEQGKMCILEAGDTALVISNTVLNVGQRTDASYSMDRNATYVFKREEDKHWRCIIDNSYGVELLDVEDKEK